MDRNLIGFELSPMEIERRVKEEKAQQDGLKELKKVKNLVDLQKLLQELGRFGLHLYSKRKGHWAFDFRQATNPNKTEYLYDDGVSSGLSQFKNLYRHLKIR